VFAGCGSGSAALDYIDSALLPAMKAGHGHGDTTGVLFTTQNAARKAAQIAIFSPLCVRFVLCVDCVMMMICIRCQNALRDRGSG
jgi:hypothetical protein